jgi:hypothetical protein
MDEQCDAMHSKKDCTPHPKNGRTLLNCEEVSLGDMQDKIGHSGNIDCTLVQARESSAHAIITGKHLGQTVTDSPSCFCVKRSRPINPL